MRMQLEAQALSGLVHMLILATLADRSLQGHEVIKSLKQSGGGAFRVPDQAVYPALHRLEHFEFVSSSWSVVDGRHRRTYQLTPEGQERLRDDRIAWEKFAAIVGEVIRAEEPSCS